jgi:hypothetical protein
MESKTIYINQDLSGDNDDSTFIDRVANECYDRMIGIEMSIGGSLMRIETSKINIDNIEIKLEKRDDGNISAQITGPDYLEETKTLISTYLQPDFIMNFDNGHKIRHELVSKIIDQTSTDVHLGNYFNMDINKTPDFLFYVEATTPYYLVVEVSTSGANAAYNRAYNKLHSYYESLLSISKHKQVKIFLAVIIVTPYFVISNVHIDENTANLMSLMWTIGEQIYLKGLGMGLFAERVHDEDEAMDNISNSILKQITNKPLLTPIIKELTITKEFVESINKLKPDMEQCKIHFKTSINKVLEDVRGLGDHNRKFADFVQKKEDYFSATNKDSAIKYNSVINMPFMTVPMNDKDDFIIVESKTPLQQLWLKCMDSYYDRSCMVDVEERSQRLIREAVCNIQEEVTEYEEERKRLRKSTDHPDILKKLPGIEQYLQCDGLWAKGSKDPIVLAKQKHSKVPISPDSPLDDIEDFINDTSIYTSMESDKLLSHPIDLLERASELVGNTSDLPVDILNMLTETVMFNSLYNISLIATELNAELQHHVPRGRLIVKKVPGRQIFMAIYPTKSREHIFMSLYVPKDSIIRHQLPFRKCEESNDGYFFPFVSFKQHKLKNLILAPFMFINLFSFWAHFYDHALSSIEYLEDINKNMMTMINYCMLVFLEDKSRTEEIITLSRYFYVDLMNCKGRIPIYNPAKLISKLPTFFRTRLELFTTKKLLSSVSMMMQSIPEKTDSEIDATNIEEADDISKDTFKNLKNFITGEEVKQGSKIIQIMYIGYLVNKNKLTDKNSDFSMVKKLISASLAVTKDDVKNIGFMEDGIIPKSQQFSAVCIKTGANLMIQDLKSRYGNKWQQTLMSNICKNLSKHMTHEIATLKASCSAILKNINLSKDNIELRQSKKVLETISENIEKFGLNPFENIVKIIEDLENVNLGLIIKLFKKNQHGGLREISILEIHGRIVALFIETISRTICREFDYEVLTHPENKLRLLESHKRDMYEKASSNGSVVIESCNSSDKTRWNQNFTMHALSTSLFCFLPANTHGIIARSFNLWVNKHIILPESVKKLLQNNTVLNDDIYSLLLKQYNGDFSDDTLPLFDVKHSEFLNIQSCMMQGILHFTSSLLHAICITLNKKLIKFYLPPSYVTGVVTSDDSALVTSIIVPKSMDRKKAEKIKIVMDYVMCAAEEFTRWFSMTPSTKSVLACSHFVEFNSEFIIGNNLVVPTIKYVVSGLNLSESESLIHRFDTLYNQLSDIFSKGLPSQNTMICQWSQGLLHYHSIGLRNSSLFGLYKSNILKHPEPALGFFPIDNELVPGVIGLAYSIYHIRRNANILRLPSKAMATNDVIAHKTGMISNNYILKMGEYTRHENLVKCISKTSKKEAEELVNENPEVIYKLPKNIEDVRIRLIMKSLAPGVANSLKHGDEFVKSFQSSIYSMYAHCFTKLITIRDEEGVRKEFEKVSLISELSDLIHYRKEEESTYFSNNDVNLLRTAFPNYQMYDEIQDVFSKMRNKTVVVKKMNRRNRKCNVLISSPIFTGSISFLEIVRWKWWGISINASENRINLAWNEYKLANPWLCDNCEESLNKSPFENHLSLFYYISSAPTRTRKIVLNCPPIRAKKFLSQLLAIAKRCLGTNLELSTSESTSTHIPIIKSMTSIYLTTCIPDEDTRKDYFNKYSSSITISKNDLDNTDKMHYKDVELINLLAYRRKIITSQELLEFFFSKGHGMMVSYIKEQRKIRGKYEGEGIVILRTRSLIVKLYINESVVIRMETNNKDLLVINSGLVMEKFKAMRLELNTSFNKLSFIGKQIMENCPGTELIIKPLDNECISDYEEFEIIPEYMSIATYQVVGRRKILISNLKTHDMCISNIDSSVTTSEWSKSWCEMIPLDIKSAESYIITIADNTSWQAKFLRALFVKRYNFRHSNISNLPNIIATMPVVTYDEDAIMTNALSAINDNNLFDNIEIDTQEDWNCPDLENIDMFPVDLFSSSHTFDTTVVDHHKESYMSVHPMWDRLINKVNPRLITLQDETADIVISSVQKILLGTSKYRIPSKRAL